MLRNAIYLVVLSCSYAFSPPTQVLSRLKSREHAQAAPRSTNGPQNVVLISVDGMRTDYLWQVSAFLPTRLIRERSTLFLLQLLLSCA